MHTMALDDQKAREMLSKAARIVTRASLEPEALFRRLRNVGLVFGGSVALAVVALVVLLAGGAASEQAQLLMVFVLLGASAVALTASIAFGLIAWGGFVQQRVRALEARMEAYEAANGVTNVMTLLRSPEARETICARVGGKGIAPEVSEWVCYRTLDVTAELASERLETEYEEEEIAVAVAK